MTPASLTIVIPTEIVALSDLSLAERVALSHMQKFPGCSNARLASLLGMSLRGVEQMLRRLRQRGLIQQVGRGRARLHRLTFHMERRIECGKNQDAESHIESGEIEIAKSHIACAPGSAPDPELNVDEQTKALSTKELIAIAVDDELERARDRVGCGDFEGALHYYDVAKQRVKDFPDTMLKARAEVLAIVMEDETRVLVLRLLLHQAKAANMPQSKLLAALAAVKALSRDRLVELRPIFDTQKRLGAPVDISVLLTGEAGHDQ